MSNSTNPLKDEISFTFTPQKITITTPLSLVQQDSDLQTEDDLYNVFYNCNTIDLGSHYVLKIAHPVL